MAIDVINTQTGHGLFVSGCVDSDVLVRKDATNGDTRIDTVSSPYDLVSNALEEVGRAVESDVSAMVEEAPHPRVSYLGETALNEAMRQFE